VLYSYRVSSMGILIGEVMTEPTGTTSMVKVGYFYLLDDSTLGPVSYEELVSLAKETVLNPEVLVRTEEQGDWHPAGEIAGLFHKAGRAEDVSRWRAEQRKKGSGGRIQGSENAGETVEVGGEESSGLSREIKAAAYEAALQWRDRHQTGVGPVAVESESRLRRAVDEVRYRLRRGLYFLLSLPFVLISRAWALTGIELTLPKWLEQFLDRLFSKDSLIVGFRWGMTMAVPNLVAWGILSWSNIEAQRYPPRDPTQIPPKMFPLWGTCASEGEYLFLLVDTMLVAGVATYIGIRWLEAKLDE